MSLRRDEITFENKKKQQKKMEHGIRKMEQKKTNTRKKTKEREKDKRTKERRHARRESFFGIWGGKKKTTRL